MVLRRRETASMQWFLNPNALVLTPLRHEMILASNPFNRTYGCIIAFLNLNLYPRAVAVLCNAGPCFVSQKAFKCLENKDIGNSFFMILVIGITTSLAVK